ncbi:MAG: hypothetical protein AVDCRST_MAG49-2940 [uncultured Thermomicrobiales bacterium]|uniref:Crossover junction endonuclease MUS81-like HHH domain-containing protein n=1 Tax=uncultured Thermomicrobiales bacterium TaxID=1645740 RepID=A0A6J4UP60_9BACT|nr:MAG: hypothetical protein AVDCRST_MAG49-2940 [uncultured Thermomicrobiales bacterium]
MTTPTATAPIKPTPITSAPSLAGRTAVRAADVAPEAPVRPGAPRAGLGPSRRHPTNRDAAEVLFNVATILELAEDNPYRVRAYRNAARLLLRSRQDARVQLTAEGELALPGLGKRLRRKLGELLTSGRMGFYVELCADLPPEVSQLMQIPTVGPKTAMRLREELGLGSPTEVRDAALAGRIRALYGFGAARERQLLEGAEATLAGRPKRLAAPPVEGDGETPPPPPPAKPVALPRPGQLTLPEAA